MTSPLPQKATLPSQLGEFQLVETAQWTVSVSCRDVFVSSLTGPESGGKAERAVETLIQSKCHIFVSGQESS
jgi:hypothetical protein